MISMVFEKSGIFTSSPFLEVCTLASCTVLRGSVHASELDMSL